jgi:REP element-mobilizing transposase RayT
MKNRKPNRLYGYNYSQNGYYFVTVSTKDRCEWFGKIKNDIMELNEYGEIAKKAWLEIQNHFKNIELNEFVVMPNHVHGIIVIVGDRHACPLQIKRQYQILPVVIGSYKSAVTRYINQIKNDKNFHWQRSFYDRVIRNENELAQIQEYILNNPKKLDLDTENMHVGDGLNPPLHFKLFDTNLFFLYN